MMDASVTQAIYSLSIGEDLLPGFYGPPGVIPWPLLVLETRKRKTQNFPIEDGHALIRLLESTHPEVVNVQPVKIGQDSVEQIVQFIFDNASYCDPKGVYTLFGDLIEFKNEQFGSHISLPGIEVQMLRPAPVISPTIFTSFNAARRVREMLGQSIVVFQTLSESQQKSLIFLSAIFNGALLDVESQKSFLRVPLASSRKFNDRKKSSIPQRVYLSSISRGWVMDPITQGLVDQFIASNELQDKSFSLCPERSDEKTLLEFVLSVEWIFQTTVGHKICPCSQLERLGQLLSQSRRQISSKGVNGWRPKTFFSELKRLLKQITDVANGFFAFQLRPIHFQVSKNDLDTTALEPSLFSARLTDSTPIKSDVQLPMVIQTHKLLHRNATCSSKALNVLIGSIEPHLKTGKLSFAREQVSVILNSQDLDNGEGIEISESEAELFKFLVCVALGHLEVGRKKADPDSFTKRDILEFLNFLTVCFCTFLPALDDHVQRENDPEKGQADELSDLVANSSGPFNIWYLDESSWIAWIEDAHDVCPKSFKVSWFASLAPLVGFLNDNGINLDPLDDFDFNVVTNHLGFYGARAHYAPYGQIMNALLELYYESFYLHDSEDYKAAEFNNSAFLVGILCLNLGLRLREATELLCFDVQWFDEVELTGEIIVRPSQFRTLKSGQAKRRLPLTLIPYALRQLLHSQWKKMSGERGRSSGLFATSGFEGSKSFAGAVSKLIVAALRKDPSLQFITVHSLRHVAINNAWAAIGISHGWLLPEVCVGSSLGKGLSDMAAHFQGELEADAVRVVTDPDVQATSRTKKEGSISINWASSETEGFIAKIRGIGLHLYRQLAGRDLESFETPMDSYYLLIRFAGHLSPKTTIHTYLHFLELAIFSDLQRSLPVLCREQIYSLFGVNKDWVTRRLKDRPPYFSDLQWLGLQH